MAAGYTLQMPSEERKMTTKTQFMSEIATLLGGCSAEKLKFGEMTTGASNDLIRASDIARKIVKEYGMSPLGLISFGEKEEMVFLGKELGEQRNYSEKVAEKIDIEIAKFIDIGEKLAKETLAKKRLLLDKVANALIERETIEREEFESLIGIKQTDKKTVEEK
jgi:cell division protease FtsH